MLAQASERRLLRGGSSKDERSASHQAVTLAPQRSIMGLPLTSVVNKGLHFLTKNSQKVPRAAKRSLSAVIIIFWLEFVVEYQIICNCVLYVSLYERTFYNTAMNSGWTVGKNSVSFFHCICQIFLGDFFGNFKIGVRTRIFVSFLSAQCIFL